MIGILEDIAEESIESTNFFHSGAEATWHQQNPDPECVQCSRFESELELMWMRIVVLRRTDRLPFSSLA